MADCRRSVGIVSLCGLILALTTVVVARVVSELPPPQPTRGDAERGRVALTTRSFLPAAWKRAVFEAVRDQLGPDAPDPKSDPDAYLQAFQERYGLHPAPYPNDGLPMGLRLAPGRDGTSTGLHIDCLVCHGGSLGGTSFIGLGNTQLDVEALLRDLGRANGERPRPALFTLNSTRGTNNAGMIDVALLTLRNPDLSWRSFPLFTGANLPELDTPAWWNLAKKRTKYYDGRTPAEAVRSNMQFLLADLTRAEFEALESTFVDIDAYLRSLTPPKYPFAIDADLANDGVSVFAANCARCHGTYGPEPTYPNKIVPLDVIKTDPARARGMSDRFVAHYNASWFGAVHPVSETCEGYQAPPLDGVWATAPYLHNGSVPSLYLLLKSSERPTRFTRPPSTEFAHYDTAHVGWKFDRVEKADPSLPSREKKRIVDTTRFGLGNQGHTFGDALSEADRRALIEYLKTL